MRIRRLSHFGIAFSLIFTVLIMAEAYLGNDGLIKSVPTTHKVISLTFDDGPHPDSTPKLLAILREKDVKATMFVLGQSVDENPALFAQMVADGHEIGSHAYNHIFISKLNAKERAEQFEKAERSIMIAAPKPVLFRPPGGGYNDGVVQDALRRGYRTVLWSIDTRDWSRPGVNQIVNHVMKKIKPGSIVLMHDGQYDLQTAAAVGVIIDRIRAEGYTLVTVGELLQYYEERE
ncbi:Peptidoglycan-N-acetylglucosamine deacetylase [bioreactor metagenome]|uniref:Peptidoglycan-N-acetylglucosamine deacetylase n=1 Tax=bioreactor metagenome TaxID=1076179 RepID=A0A644SVA1_9ZZZZ